MITKAEAIQYRATYISLMPSRLEAAIRAAALAGQTSVAFNYTPVAAATVDAFIASTMVPAGWTNCVNDNVNFILTVA